MSDDRHILSILLKNASGALSRVVGLFAAHEATTLRALQQLRTLKSPYFPYDHCQPIGYRDDGADYQAPESAH